MKHTAPHKRYARGTSLIEVLVSVLILSIGLLTMAGIHAASLKFSKANEFRISASEIAQMLGESIKANPTAQLNAGATQVLIAGAYAMPAVGTAITAPGNMCNNPAAPVCNAAAIAAVDLFNARRTARALLPLGDIFTAVNGAGTAAPSLSVWVHWAAPSTNKLGAPADQPAWASGSEVCPPAVQALAPPRQCTLQTIPL